MSFNYDLFFEAGMSVLPLQANGQRLVHTVAAVMDHDYMDLPANFVVVRKVHGSVQYALRTLLTDGIHEDQQHPWKAHTSFKSNVQAGGVETEVDLTAKLTTFPFIPDIVPPGHSGDDICNPISFSLDRAREQINNSKLVLFCGLSGNPPDTEEVRSLVQSIRSDSTVIHVGLESDRTGCLAKLLEEAGFKARSFVRAEDLLVAVPQILKGVFPLRYTWSLAWPATREVPAATA